MNSCNAIIDSIASMKKSLSEGMNIKAKDRPIRRIMKDDLKMRYRKIVTVSLKVNVPKNLILRQQFALKLIETMNSGKKIINVDETWLGLTDWRRMKWQAPGTTNSILRKMMLPSVTMITALDTNGEVYLSLLQSNSNSQVMELQIRQLVLQLDKQRKNWRDDTVIMLDNAKYHTSASMLNLLEGLNIPVLFTGPHSYAASPIELFFAEFKEADINPRCVPTVRSFSLV